MPEVVSGTLPFTFSTFVLLGDVAESLVVVVLLLLLHAKMKEDKTAKMKSLFMPMVLVPLFMQLSYQCSRTKYACAIAKNWF